MVVAHAFNPSTQKAETGESLWVQDQPGLQELVSGQTPKLHRETLFQNKINKIKQKTKIKHIKIKQTNKKKPCK